MLHTLKMLVIAVAGLWLGLAGTYYAVERGEDGGVGTSFLFGAVKAGPWTGWPKSGTRDADPYARALYARNGETPLGITEGLSFLARADSSGAPLNPACDYVLSGAIPPARFWTLSAATPHGKPYLLMLRLYDTALSANAYSVVAQAMPSIVKEHCR